MAEVDGPNGHRRGSRPGPRPPYPATHGPLVGGGTVVLPFGRYFAAKADLLTREGFKTVVPIDGISPFTAIDEPDPAMQHLAESDRVNERAATDVRKDLAARLAGAHADVLVVDNTAALLFHREVGGRLYTVVPGEDTELTDSLWNDDETAARAEAFKPSRLGLTATLRARYDAFVHACLDSFAPDRIILIRAHAPRFRVTGNGRVRPTDLERADALLLEQLDDYFLERTGCLVSDAALDQFPTGVKWQSFDRHRLRRALEDDLVRLCTGASSHRDVGSAAAVRVGHPVGSGSAADHVVEVSRTGGAVDGDWLTRYFAAGGASYDDLLALVHLQQGNPSGNDELVRRCVRLAVADERSAPVATTRRRFERSVEALQGWPWGPLGGLRSRRRDAVVSSLRGWRWGSVTRGRGGGAAPRGRLPRLGEALRGVGWGLSRKAPARLWTPQVALPCGDVVLRFLADGSLLRTRSSPLGQAAAEAAADGQLDVTPSTLLAAAESWAFWLQRGRRGITQAPRVVVRDLFALVDSCSWLDWASVLDGERWVVTTGDPASVPARWPAARTDLSFVFDPGARIGTVGGGLGDQVTHIALFDDLCRRHGLEYYLDDLRYTWWRSHNGFEASRLAPGLEARRLTRLVAPALVESLRAEIVKTRLPWVYSQSQAWHDVGLPEATVVTRDYVNSRRLLEIGPGFPVLVYDEDEELDRLIREPPAPVTFYTTQQRIPVVDTSAPAIRRVFSYRHLEASGLPPDVARTAALLRSGPHVALHVRRGDYLDPHFDTGGWHSAQSHYIEALDFVQTELGTPDLDLAVFSDDLEFVSAHAADYGLDRVRGQVRLVRGNHHYTSIFDSYLMSLCPVIVGSVGFFAATTSLLADPPSTFVRARPDGVRVEWRR